MSNNLFKTENLSDNTLLINTGARLDNSNAHILLQQINQALADHYNFIFLDMNSAEFISSAGVGSILGTIESFRNAGGDIIIYNASENILRVFEVLDILDYLTIKESRTEALELTTP